jgi:hypothetical protein
LFKPLRSLVSLNGSKTLYQQTILFFFFFFVILRLELKAYTLSHCTSPFL